MPEHSSTCTFILPPHQLAMKFAIITAALGLALGASASIRYEYGTNGSFKAISTPDSPAPARAKLARSAGGGCSNCRDRCLRGVISASVYDADFCNSFFATTFVAAPAALQTQCVSADRVSSACSCLVQPTTSSSTVPSATPTPSSSTEPSATPTPSTSPSSTEPASTPSATPTAPACGAVGSFCDINNFIQQCCQASDSSVGCYFPTGDPLNGQCFI